MIHGIISQELHEQLLDLKNYQNRTNGVEELKRVLSEVDMTSVAPNSIEEFIHFLPRLLDDSNFKVLHGTLQVLNVLIQKLDTNVDRYVKQIVLVALKALGDTRTVTRNEYMNVFRQIMKTVAPQQVLDLVTGNLKHKNSRVREDVLNIIIAALLTHPREDFNISKLCFEVAPYLADSKRIVRQAALELFAVFDYCLDTGEKKLLMKAVDMVELNEEAESLAAAVQARRERHVLPKLTSDGIVEYGLVVPKPGQWCSAQYGSGADLDWVINGGRISGARSYRTEPHCERLYGYGSLGSLADDCPFQRRLVSAGNGRSKLPWEMTSFSTTDNDQHNTVNGKCSEQKIHPKVANEDFLPLSEKLNSDSYISSFRSTLSPTLTRRHADSTVCMSNTSPNKRASNPHHHHHQHQHQHQHQQEPSPRSDAVATTLSCCQALTSDRTPLSVPPAIPQAEHSHNGQRSNAPDSPPNQQREAHLHCEPLGTSTVRDAREEELDMREMLNCATTMHNIVKKRAKAGLRGSDPDPESHDPAVSLDPGLDSTPHTSATLTGSPGEGGDPSLSSVANPSFSCMKTSPGDSASSGMKPGIARVPSAKLRSSETTDSSSLPESSQGCKLSSEVGVAGQRVALSNGPIKAEEEATGPAPSSVEPAAQESFRAVGPARGSHSDSSRNSSDSDLPEGIFGTDLHLNGGPPTSTEELPSDVSPLSSNSPEPQSPTKCFKSPRQLSPPTVAPNSQKPSRVRRAPSLNRTRPSLSNSSDELSPGPMGHKKSLSEPPELSRFSKPDLALTQSFNLLSSDDWEKKIEGMTFLRSLAHYHSGTFQGRLHDVCLSLIQEVKNLRSGVSRAAVCTLGDLYRHLQKAMDQELDVTVKALLQKAGESNAFIRQDVDAALSCMVQHCTPYRCINALLSGGIGHLNAVVRKCTAQHLSNVVERVGAASLLSGNKDLTDRFLPAVTKLAQDSSQEARYYGRRMLLTLSYHPDFDKILERYISTKDLPTVRDTVFTLKTKGLGEMPQDTQSARGRRSLSGSSTVRASSLTREPLSQTNRESNSGRSQSQSIADKTEYIQQISGLLGSKDVRERIKGIDQLVADCQHNPNMVINSIFPVFDAFRARLQESNSKVNLYALESLQKIIHSMKGNLAQVVNMLIPAIVGNHLNSKNKAIYSATIGAINALISNLDNVLLLQPFCTKAQFLGGKAKVDLIEKVADLVTELYPRKPQMVEQKVLPLLWHLLGTSTHNGTIIGCGGSVQGATAKLCKALYAQMGPNLAECAASQPDNVRKGLNEVLIAMYRKIKQNPNTTVACITNWNCTAVKTGIPRGLHQ